MNVIKNYQLIAPELKDKLHNLYPRGFDRVVQKIQLKDGSYWAIPFVDNDIKYLIKIQKLTHDTEKPDLESMVWEGDAEAVFEED